MRLSADLSIREGDTADRVVVMADKAGGLHAQAYIGEFCILGPPDDVAAFLVDALDRVRNAAEEASTLLAREELGDQHIRGRLTDELDAIAEFRQDAAHATPEMMTRYGQGLDAIG